MSKTKTKSPVLRIDVAGVVVGLIIAGLAYWTSLSPAVAHMMQAAQKQAAVKAARTQAADLQSEERKLQGTLQRTEKAIAACRVHLVSRDNLNQRLAELTAVGSKAGLIVEGVRPGIAVDGTRFDATPIEMSGQATFAQLHAFLGRVHRDCPDISVESMRLLRSPEGEGSARFQLKLQWFTRPDA